MALRPRVPAAGAARLLVALLLVACQAATPSIASTDARVAVGAKKTCAELKLSDVRCTLITLRAARELDRVRPDHARVTAQELHEATTPPAGQSGLPSSQVAAAVVVFTLEGGERVGVPVLCARDSAGGDQACDARVQ